VRILRDIECMYLYLSPRLALTGPVYYSTQIDEMPMNVADLLS
jgi:hypothetical protein